MKGWIYLDTSSFVKILVDEPGSREIRGEVKNNHVVSSAILSIECFSALWGKKANGEISGREFEGMAKSVVDLIRSVEIVSVSGEVLRGAEKIALESGARAMDAIHISSALLFLNATSTNLIFTTSDKKQLVAAQLAGLTCSFI